MAEKRFKLTNESVRTRCLPPAEGELNAKGKPVVQKLYWDEEQKGFGLLAGRRTKSFVVQRDMTGGRSVRVNIGRFPTWTADQARKRARELVVDVDKGIDPNAAARAAEEAQRGSDYERFTLDQAITEHGKNMLARGCAQRSIEDVRKVLARHCEDWLRKPLVALRRGDCIQRHRDITTDHGPVAANHVMRAVRACWGSAERLYEQLPAHPVKGVVFNKEYRRQEPITWEQLPEWWAKVMGIENAIRRHFHLFTLFTGLRGGDGSTVRWEHVDFAKGTIHRPQPKGGKDRAFTVPLSAFALWVLNERRAGRESNGLYYPDDGGWVFPTRDYDGNITHLQETKEQRFVEGEDGKRKKLFHLPTSHRARDTFATACLESGVGHMETKLLMNHRPPGGDVTMGYMRPSVEHLRGGVEKVAEFLLLRAEAWLPLPRRR